MRILSIVLIVGILAGLLMMTGCVQANKETEMQKTVGRELTDLKAARDQGALTDAEYNALKKQLMEHCRKRWDY